MAVHAIRSLRRASHPNERSGYVRCTRMYSRWLGGMKDVRKRIALAVARHFPCMHSIGMCMLIRSYA